VARSGQRRARPPTWGKVANSSGIAPSGAGNVRKAPKGALGPDTSLPLAHPFGCGIDLPDLVQDFGGLRELLLGQEAAVMLHDG